MISIVIKTIMNAKNQLEIVLRAKNGKNIRAIS